MSPEKITDSAQRKPERRLHASIKRSFGHFAPCGALPDSRKLLFFFLLSPKAAAQPPPSTANPVSVPGTVTSSVRGKIESASRGLTVGGKAAVNATGL